MTDHDFKLMQTAAITVWRTYDDTYNYASDKIYTVNELKNVRDNFGTIYNMFDVHNQVKFEYVLQVVDHDAYLRINHALREAGF